ncbi:MAG: NAD(P)/FAD-dependent oxidoreductase [Flavobacteriales bacterium]
MPHIVIIGNGISGITAARHIRKKSDHKITVIGDETKYFYSRTALMYIYMGHMKFEHTQPYEPEFWKKNRIDLVHARVEKINTDKMELTLNNGASISWDKLIIATGSVSNKFGWPGQNLKGVQGLYSIQDVEELERNTHPWNAKVSERRVKKAIIVGGGLIGVELAEMLHTRGIQVSFLIREKKFWGSVLPKEEAELVARHLKEHHVEILYDTELNEIHGDENSRVKSITTKNGEIIECQFVGLTAGVSPNIAWLSGTDIATNRGVLVNRFLETNVENVYALGDCVEFTEAWPGRKNIEQVWYTGRMMGETVAKTICGNRTAYQPGNWFNSAKFFDIEYQTYGTVNANLQDGEGQFYWEHSSGKICVKMVFDISTRTFKGINTFGIRMLHDVFDRWLNERQTIDYVILHLKEANFDPEFFNRYEVEIRSAFTLSVNVQNHTA